MIIMPITGRRFIRRSGVILSSVILNIVYSQLVTVIPERLGQANGSAMEKSYSPLEKDAILRDAFKKLKARGITSAWASQNQPFSALSDECRRLMTDEAFRQSLQDYVRVHTSLPRAVQMLFTCISMAARARWQEVPDEIKPIVARGWFLGRWLPTFLIIDGPIGRFVSAGDSPFKDRYGSNWVMITAARDFLVEKTFRLVRNGFAHWGFDWEVVGNNSYVVAYDWERDLPIARLHQSEADAYHIVAFAFVEVLNDVILSPGGYRFDNI